MIPIIFLLWSANVEPDLAGYRVSWGALPGQYRYYVETTDTVVIAQSDRYYAVQAFDFGQNYSLFSEEVYTMPDSIFRDETIRFRVSFDSLCVVDTTKMFLWWHPSSTNWEGSWSGLVWGGDWLAYLDSERSLIIEVYIPNLEKYLDSSIPWNVQFRFFYGDVSIDSEIFLFAKRACKPIKLERIKQ